MKCLEKGPRDRYDSAADLAEDLARFGRGEAVSASPPSWAGWILRNVRRSALRGDLADWSAMLLSFAAVVLAAQLTLAVLTLTGQALHWMVLARVAQFVLMGLVYWHRRPPAQGAGASERQLFALWAGYLLACAVMAVAARLRSGMEEPFESTLYAPWSVLTGLAFFSLGHSHWGQCYTLGLAFFFLALLAALWPAPAPIGFGVHWAVSLGVLAIKVRQPGGGGRQP